MKFERLLGLFVAFIVVLRVFFLDARASLPFVILLVIAVVAGVVATFLGHRIFRQKKT
ncbi:hypothetical protein SAMN05421781_0382 [Marinococcus luteus]|uniref:Uncharacterized protein n=1 Tax=Marinococcus luteus TaxID=1122204 RepID=A0A1H2QM52_9BACI|nr:hypothetical protein [Marinococcus luteus]SDW08277.1 hypothetical protein SAMN05421781_0382 [Marinococcus luteus]